MFMKYTINIEKRDILETDINSFLADVQSLDTIWYEIPHHFNDSWQISSYTKIIIEVNEIYDLEYVKQVYWFYPNAIYSNWIKKHLVFNLTKRVSILDWQKISSSLAYIYDWIYLDYNFFPEHNIYKLHKDEELQKWLIQFLIKYYFLINNRRERELDAHNYEEFLEINKVPIDWILTKIWLSTTDKIDTIKNIHIQRWNNFDLVTNHFNSLKKAFEFFNEFFERDFKLDDYQWEWAELECSNYFLADIFWYFRMNEKHEKKQITDFIIKVHYKIIKVDWTQLYIVSLVNNGEWIETPKIFWSNSTWKTLFSDYIQKYWSYHFYWSDTQIKQIHAAIAKSKNIPIVKSIVWYWYNAENDVIAFQNWIWDVKEKTFTERKEWDNYHFNYNWQWYFVSDNKWNPLDTIIDSWVPCLDTSKSVSINEVTKFLETLYKDDSWILLLAIAMWMFWYLLYGDQNEPFPFLFTRWVTWSWKTTFNKLLGKMWGITKWWVDFWNSTPFTMTVMLSHLIKFPYFLWEYREDIPQASMKLSTLRNVFDRTKQTKWRADQSVVSYDYHAMCIMDWEEMIEDWAVRTRTIQKQFLKNHRIEWNFDQIVREKWDILNWILFTYLLKSNKDRYKEWLKKWIEIFSKQTNKDSPRIWNNFANIYAWCYAFSNKPEFIDKIMSTLENSLEFQLRDVRENGTSMQIIKAITKFLDNDRFNTAVYDIPDKKQLVISWNLLDEYINKYRLKLSLRNDTYKEHIEALWYKIDYIDTESKMVYWVVIPYDDIPKDFLLHETFYLAKRRFDNGNNNKT